jgi:hypothetical protein
MGEGCGARLKVTTRSEGCGEDAKDTQPGTPWALPPSCPIQQEGPAVVPHVVEGGQNCHTAQEDASQQAAAQVEAVVAVGAGCRPQTS